MGPFSLILNFSPDLFLMKSGVLLCAPGLFVMVSWFPFFVSQVGEIKSGSVQSVCVLFLWLVCDDELVLLLRAPGR